MRIGCPTCKSTRREKLHRVLPLQEHKGTHEGQPYTHIYRARTRCRSCGQCYLIVEYLNEIDEKSAQRTNHRESDRETGAQS